jgi:hypothetical protein
MDRGRMPTTSSTSSGRVPKETAEGLYTSLSKSGEALI